MQIWLTIINQFNKQKKLRSLSNLLSQSNFLRKQEFAIDFYICKINTFVKNNWKFFSCTIFLFRWGCPIVLKIEIKESKQHFYRLLTYKYPGKYCTKKFQHYYMYKQFAEPWQIRKKSGKKRGERTFIDWFHKLNFIVVASVLAQKQKLYRNNLFVMLPSCGYSWLETLEPCSLSVKDIFFSWTLDYDLWTSGFARLVV